MDAVALAMIEALPRTAPTIGWTTFSDIGTARPEAAASTDGTNVYVTHGYLPANSGLAVGMVTISPSGTVTGGPNVPVQRRGVAGAWCNGKHLVIGGLLPSNGGSQAVEAYTPAGANGASGVWTSLAYMPDNYVAYCAAATLGNFVYVAGGQADSARGNAVKTFMRYDVVNNVWATMAPMPAERTQGALVPVGTKLHYIGGFDQTGGSVGTVFVFDTTTGTWSTGVALPSGQSSAAGPAVAVGSTIYLPRSNGTMYSFNVATDTAWQVSTPFTGHGDFAGGVALGSTLILVSGSGTSSVDRLDLSAGTSYTMAVLGAQSLLNPILAGVASALPNTPPTATADRAAYAQNVQTLKALAAL